MSTPEPVDSPVPSLPTRAADGHKGTFGRVLIVAGSMFVLVGGIGLIRLPDFYTRIHAAGITDTMGAWLILIGLMFSSGWSLVTGSSTTVFGSIPTMVTPK